MTGLRSHARALKLDTEAFDKCLDNSETADGVKAQLSEAQALGLQGTTTFFVNGRYVGGPATYERLRAVIAEELSAAEAKGTAAAADEATRKKVQVP